jgi:hypothetical protein
MMGRRPDTALDASARDADPCAVVRGLLFDERRRHGNREDPGHAGIAIA